MNIFCKIILFKKHIRLAVYLIFLICSSFVLFHYLYRNRNISSGNNSEKHLTDNNIVSDKLIKMHFLVKKGDTLDIGHNSESCDNSSLLLIRVEILKSSYLSLYHIDDQARVNIIKLPEYVQTGIYDLKNGNNLQAVNLSELKGSNGFLSIISDLPGAFSNEELEQIGKWVTGSIKNISFIQPEHYDFFYVSIE